MNKWIALRFVWISLAVGACNEQKPVGQSSGGTPVWAEQNKPHEFARPIDDTTAVQSNELVQRQAEPIHPTYDHYLETAPDQRRSAVDDRWLQQPPDQTDPGDSRWKTPPPPDAKEK